MGRILIVDDDEHVVSALRRLLRGHQIEQALDGVEGFTRLSGPDHFDVVICDYGMPGMTGAELYDKLAVEKPSVLPRFVFLTGSLGTRDADAFFARIPSAVVEKGAPPGLILSAVNAVLSG